MSNLRFPEKKKLGREEIFKFFIFTSKLFNLLNIDLILKMSTLVNHRHVSLKVVFNFDVRFFTLMNCLMQNSALM